ncbi:MAG: uroporphyrinogen-III decarboxylase, partial [Deltaproteobacteria bacterium]
MSNENEKLYQKRLARIKNAINLEPVDRVPCIFMGMAFAPRYMGMSQHKYCVDGTAAVDVTIEAMKRLGNVDGINQAPGGIHPMSMTYLWLSRLLIPGIDLDEEALWQVVEKEIMAKEDYDLVIDKGAYALVDKILPQVCDMKMMEENFAWHGTHGHGVNGKFCDAGFVVVSHGAVATPFDTLCGARSMNQFFFDLYRMPDKVEEAMDVMVPYYIEQGLSAAGPGDVSGMWVGGWRTASAMLAPKLWDRFVWPYIKKISTAL